MLVLVLSAVLAIAAGYGTVTRLGINTNATNMLSEDLPFRRNDAAMTAAFPQFTNVLSIVVEGNTPDRAEDAAARLADALRAEGDLFRDVFYAEGDAFFRRNGLLYLDRDQLEALADRLAEAQPLLSALQEDLSLRGLSRALIQALDEMPAGNENAVAALAPVLDQIAASARSLADVASGKSMGPPRPLSWIAVMRGGKIEPADMRRFILVQPVLDFESLQPAARAIAAVHARAAALGLDRAAGLRVRVTGSPAMLQDELKSVRDGMGLVGLVSAVLVLALLIVGLRAPRLILATVVALVVGLIWTAGFATVAVGELNLISVAFAVLFIGLSVDFGIHFALRYQEALRGDPAERADPLSTAAGHVGGALGLCALTAAIGFFSFVPTSYRGLAELGLISGAGMFIALFANLTVLPAVLALLPVRANGPAPGSPLAARAQALILGHPRAVVGGALLLGLASLAFLPYARFDDDPLNLRDPRSESVATLLDLLDDPRVNPYSAEVLAPDLDAAGALAARLEALPEVDSAATLADYVPRDQDEKLALIEEMSFFLTPVFLPGGGAPPLDGAGRRAALDRLIARLAVEKGPLAPAARRLADALGGVPNDPSALEALETLLLGGLPARIAALGEALDADTPVTLADLPPALRDRNVTADGRARVEIIPRDDLRDAGARRRFVDAVRAVAPDAGGMPIIITEAGRAVVRAFFEAAGYAMALIAVVLLGLLRSVRDSLLVLAPLALAASLTMAVTVIFATPFNFANVIVLPLLFGLGVAGGIHMVMRARASGAGALMRTSTPRAVLFSALTTIGSFGALALSSHVGTASMGFLLTVAIGLSLVCTLVTLPALLSLVPARARGAGDRS